MLINFICCFAVETELVGDDVCELPSPCHLIQRTVILKRKNTNTSTPNDLGLQISTQNVFLLQGKIHS